MHVAPASIALFGNEFHKPLIVTDPGSPQLIFFDPEGIEDLQSGIIDGGFLATLFSPMQESVKVMSDEFLYDVLRSHSAKEAGLSSLCCWNQGEAQ